MVVQSVIHTSERNFITGRARSPPTFFDPSGENAKYTIRMTAINVFQLNSHPKLSRMNEVVKSRPRSKMSAPTSETASIVTSASQGTANTPTRKERFDSERIKITSCRQGREQAVLTAGSFDRCRGRASIRAGVLRPHKADSKQSCSMGSATKLRAHNPKQP